MFLPLPSASLSEPARGHSPATGVLVIGTGERPRIGLPKELLSFRGKTMLRRCIETALDLNCGPVAVAIGRPNEPIRQNIAGTDVIVMEDAGVLNGQGAILKTGLTALLRHTPELRGVLITVCDQPLVDGKSLRHLINAPTGLAASAFLGTSGLPAWVSRCFFDELLALEDHGTLHSLLARHRNEVTAVSIPEAAIDIDTFAGLAALAP